MKIVLNYCAGREFDAPTHSLEYFDENSPPRVGEHIRLSNPSHKVLLLEVVRVTHNLGVSNNGISPGSKPTDNGYMVRVRPGVVIPLGERKNYPDSTLQAFGFRPR